MPFHFSYNLAAITAGKPNADQEPKVGWPRFLVDITASLARHLRNTAINGQHYVVPMPNEYFLRTTIATLACGYTCYYGED